VVDLKKERNSNITHKISEMDDMIEDYGDEMNQNISDENENENANENESEITLKLKRFDFSKENWESATDMIVFVFYCRYSLHVVREIMQSAFACGLFIFVIFSNI
jgi:hypothetical protein